jgi:uncharacterized protein (TIGR00255 family)
MESMTGYGYIEKSTSQFSFSIEIKSLNSKFLEIYTNLPKIIGKDENDITQILKNKFNRGKIVLTIEIFDWIEKRSVSFNKDILKKYFAELKQIEKELKVENYFSGDILFSFDNVKHTNKTLLSKHSHDMIYNTLNQIIDRTIKMRIKEGNVTKKDIQNSLYEISDNLIKVKEQYKDISKILFNKLKKTIESISDKTVNDVRLYTEVAILADKIDINEEIVRLNDHIKKFKSVMNDNGQIGKKLDFLAQEMFRETNTISSKANSSEISYMVVNMKNHIDKIREHSRNII